MQITNKLPQFKNKKTLLVATGPLHAIIYVAFDGEIEKIHDIKKEEPKYSDNEGMFKSSAAPGAYGSVLESKRDKVTKELSKELSNITYKELKKREIDQIYLYVAPKIKKHLEHDLPTDVKKCIKHTFFGNYASGGSKKLLELILQKKEEMRKNKKKPKGQAKKILEKANQVKKFSV